jgi:hypothetical protein
MATMQAIPGHSGVSESARFTAIARSKAVDPYSHRTGLALCSMQTIGSTGREASGAEVAGAMQID